MELRELGEFGLIERIARAARKRGSGRAVVVGIGDDAAVLRPRAGEDLVTSIDAMVEGVHFRWQTQSPRQIGRRALVSGLSDLAAMGARPLGCTVGLAAPPGLSLQRVDSLVAGLLDEASTHACPLVGGNLTRASETSLHVSVQGAVARGRALTRGGARPGDRICVTGTLGGMALEVARAERGGGRVRRVPEPRLRAGRALARQRGIGGCIDVSDGLEADLGHLLAAGRGKLGAEIETARVPGPRGFAAACARAGLDPERLALTGGEDYELLFTVRPNGPSAAQLARRLGLPVTEIGRVAKGAPGRPHGAPGGWRHF